MTLRDQLHREITLPGFVLPSVVAMTVVAAGLAAGPHSMLHGGDADGFADDPATRPAEVQPLTVDPESAPASATSTAAGDLATAANAADPAVAPAGTDRDDPRRVWLGHHSSPVDPSARLAPLQPTTPAMPRSFAPASSPTRTVGIHTDDRRQTWLGVGGALTDATVELLEGREGELRRLFDPSRRDGAALNLVRLPMSATDFSRRSWTSDQRPDGGFEPAPEARRAARLLAEIRRVRDDAEVVAAAWTAPDDMVDADGNLADEERYADLLVATATWLRDRNVPLHALTLGNEPGYRAEYPSMLMTDDQMIQLGEAVAPELDRAGVELWALDHNWSDRQRVDVLTRRSPGTFDAAAFHCYDGQPSQMADLAVPAIVSECTGTDDNWTSTFGWDSRVLVAESIRAGSTGLMMWNLALPPAPEVLPGGCDRCRGLLTIDPETGEVTETPEFYTLAHLARAADPGAVVVGTDDVDGLPVVAFANPDGTIGIFGHNDGPDTETVEFVLADGESLRTTVAPWSMFDLRSAPLPVTGP